MRTMLVVLAMYSLAVFAEVQNAPLNLMPMPANIKIGVGQLVVDPSFSVAISGRKEPRLQRTVEIFLDHLRRQTGMLPLDMKISDSSTGALLIDAGRHFMPLDVIKRNLDGMAGVKLNVFHWHLSENQGFRVESKKFPKLHEMGSDGLYYTQSEVRDVIAYARDRGIRVTPEFDM